MRYLTCDRLFRGTGTPINDAGLLIDDGRIAAVGPREGIDPGDAERVDHRDATVVPGLIDAHLHLGGARTMDPFTWVRESSELGAARATADLRALLGAGFTTVGVATVVFNGYWSLGAALDGAGVVLVPGVVLLAVSAVRWMRE